MGQALEPEKECNSASMKAWTKVESSGSQKAWRMGFPMAYCLAARRGSLKALTKAETTAPKKAENLATPMDSLLDWLKDSLLVIPTGSLLVM